MERQLSVHTTASLLTVQASHSPPTTVSVYFCRNCFARLFIGKRIEGVGFLRGAVSLSVFRIRWKFVLEVRVYKSMMHVYVIPCLYLFDHGTTITFTFRFFIRSGHVTLCPENSCVFPEFFIFILSDTHQPCLSLYI